MRLKIKFKYWKVVVGFIAVGVTGYFLYWVFNGFSIPEHKTTTNPDAYPESGWRMLHDFVYYSGVFWLMINFYYDLLANRRKIIEYVKVTLVVVGAAFVYKTFLLFAFPTVLQARHDTPLSLYRAMLQNVPPLIIVTFLVAYLLHVRESLKQRRILEAQKLQLEAQISQANFNFLKAQINPHFLHNTLNFLYAKSLPFSPELSEGILTLSDIMRYALGQGNQKDGKAPLKDEIEHVNNVIKISQLRYNNTLKVNFEVTGNVNGAMIIPFVLITIVENAFKHGDLKDQQHPIDIRLEVKGERLSFYCRNKKKTGPKQLSTGIGLENIRKRLELAYGDKFKYNVKDEMEFYTTELIIEQL